MVKKADIFSAGYFKIVCIYNELRANSWNRLVNERKVIADENTSDIYMLTMS